MRGRCAGAAAGGAGLRPPPGRTPPHKAMKPMHRSHAGLSPNLSLRQVVHKPAVRSSGGIVVSQHRLASEIGARVLAAGGHAVDAAVATSFAVGVLEPWMSGVGGVGAMLVR